MHIDAHRPYFNPGARLEVYVDLPEVHHASGAGRAKGGAGRAKGGAAQHDLEDMCAPPPKAMGLASPRHHGRRKTNMLCSSKDCMRGERLVLDRGGRSQGLVRPQQDAAVGVQ